MIPWDQSIWSSATGQDPQVTTPTVVESVTVGSDSGVLTATEVGDTVSVEVELWFWRCSCCEGPMEGTARKFTLGPVNND